MLKAALIFGMFCFISAEEQSTRSPLVAHCDSVVSCINYLKVHYATQVLVGLLTIIIILFTSIARQEKSKNEVKSLNCVRKISVEEYERQKAELTKEALKKLEATPEYQSFKDRYDRGEVAPVELDEDDKIDLSDDNE